MGKYFWNLPFCQIKLCNVREISYRAFQIFVSLCAVDFAAFYSIGCSITSSSIFSHIAASANLLFGIFAVYRPQLIRIRRNIAICAKRCASGYACACRTDKWKRPYCFILVRLSKHADADTHADANARLRANGKPAYIALSAGATKMIIIKYSPYLFLFLKLWQHCTIVSAAELEPAVS